MPFLTILAVAAGLVLLPGPGGLRPGPEIGKPAPGFMLLDAQGRKHSLADYKGKVVVIEWVNVTCPDARVNYQSGHIPQMQKKYKAKGVIWLSMIITERQQSEYGEDVITPARADSMAHAMGEQYGAIPTAMLIDAGGAVGAAYDTRTSMHMFVIDKKGLLAYDGALDDHSDAEAFYRKLHPEFFGKESESDTNRTHENYVAAAVDQLLAGKPVTTTMTMPYGCHPVGRYLDSLRTGH